MYTFFKDKTASDLYNHLINLSKGIQSIRQADQIVRLLSPKEGNEENAQEQKRDWLERIHIEDADSEIEKMYADKGTVIQPLKEEFKEELKLKIG